ncbi:MAG: TetR/AcrR family transcriptional regulator, partial [Pseudomonadota bacterium]
MQKRVKGAERKDLFLEAAAAIVLDQGVGAVTMEGVAQRCGVNKSLPYRYFADRDAVLAALFDREHAKYAAWWAEALPADPTFEAAVRAALRHWCARADDGQELYLRLVTDSGRMRERARGIQEENVRGWAAGLERAYGLPAKVARQYAWFMVTGVTGFLAARDGDDDALIDTVTLAVVAGAEALRA